jgi:hypothetical protein
MEVCEFEYLRGGKRLCEHKSGPQSFFRWRKEDVTRTHSFFIDEEKKQPSTPFSKPAVIFLPLIRTDWYV